MLLHTPAIRSSSRLVHDGCLRVVLTPPATARPSLSTSCREVGGRRVRVERKCSLLHRRNCRLVKLLLPADIGLLPTTRWLWASRNGHAVTCIFPSTLPYSNKLRDERTKRPLYGIIEKAWKPATGRTDSITVTHWKSVARSGEAES
jgi:hypothetical protein